MPHNRHILPVRWNHSGRAGRVARFAAGKKTPDSRNATVAFRATCRNNYEQICETESQTLTAAAEMRAAEHDLTDATRSVSERTRRCDSPR